MSSSLALFGGPKAVTLPSPTYPVIGHEEVTGAVRTIMERQMSVTTHAGVVAEMEEAYATYFGSKYCHAYNSGTAAIHSALFGVGVGPGDEVLTASHTWISAITAICHAGAVPVFCDIDPNRGHIDPEEIRRKAGPHTKAVIATHLHGFPADMDAIMAAAREKNLKVIEDVSHAHGGKYKGQYLGTIGDAGCFSLQGSKSIVAGEGGVMVTNDHLCYERSMIPGDHGLRLKSELTLPELEPFTQGGGAWTYRIAPPCAAIAIAQLQRLADLTAIRQANFDQLHARLSRNVPFLRFPQLDEGSQRGWYGTPVHYTFDQEQVSRDLFVRACAAEGVGLIGPGYNNWYSTPLFQDTSLYGQLWHVEHTNGVRYEPIKPGSQVNNEALRSKLIVLPIAAERCEALIDQMADAIEKVAENMDELVTADQEQLACAAGA